MAFNFPDSPAVNDEYTAHGVTYRWDGTVWEAQGGGTYVAKIGDTMTGPLEIRCPTNYLQLDGTDGWAGLDFLNNGVPRWDIQGSDPTTGNLEFYPANDAGVYGPAVFWLERATGKATFEQEVHIKKSLEINGSYPTIKSTIGNSYLIIEKAGLANYMGLAFRQAGMGVWSLDIGTGTTNDLYLGRWSGVGSPPGGWVDEPITVKWDSGDVLFQHNVALDFDAVLASGVVSKGGITKLNGSPILHRRGGFIVLCDGTWNGVLPLPYDTSIWLGFAGDRTIYFQGPQHFFYSEAVANQLTINDAGITSDLAIPSTSPTTGTLRIAGGVGIVGNLNVGGTIGVPVLSTSNLHLDGILFANRTVGNYTRIYDMAGVAAVTVGDTNDPTNYFVNTSHRFLPRAGGAPWAIIDASGLAIAPTTPSTSPITGALRVAGGVGIAGALWLGGAFNFTGAGHIVHQSPGAGFWYDSITAANRFFLGTDAAADTFRLFSAPAGNNVFIIDAVTMATSFNAKISTPIGADNQLGDVTVARSPDIGVIHFGSAKSRYLYFDGTNFTLAGGPLIVGGSKITATHFDAATATLGYQLGGVAAFFRSGNYHVLQSQDGGGNLILGQAAEPSNYYTNTNHFFRDRANTIVMSLIGGALTLQHAVPEVVIAKSASGQAARIYGRTGGSNRWHITLGNQGVESGGDAGSEFVIARYLDSGASTTAMSIQRSNGAVIIPGTLTVQSAGSFQTLSTTGAVNFPGIVNLASVGAIGQNSSGNIQITAPTGHHAFISFHIAGQFATQFGLAADGNFYMGGWSHPSISYRFWTTRDFASVPAIGSFVSNGRLAYAGDFVHYSYVGFGEPFGGAVVTGMSPTDGAGNATARYRYLQLYTTSWFTVGYA